MSGIFISYRRDDSRHAAGRLADDLADAFGRESIFRDIEGIDPGLDFTETLERALARCDVMLVLIGPRWLDIADEQGRRRLLQPGDWIRQELATALDRNIRVVPVLLEGARLPSAEQLPEDLHRLPRRQWFELSDLRWRGDLQRLVEALAKVPGLELRGASAPASPVPVPPAPTPAPAPTSAPPKSGRKTLFTGIGLGAVGILVLAVMLAEEPLDDPDPDPGHVVVPEFGGAAPLSAPLAAPLSAPLAAPNGVQPQPPTLADLPDVSGRWQASTGEMVVVEQAGIDLRLTMFEDGAPAGAGVGQIEGPLMQLALAVYAYGTGAANTLCELHQTPGGRRWNGSCEGPEGLFEVTISR